MRDFKAIDLWHDVTNEEWNDWKWQLKNRITSVEQLEKLVSIPPDAKNEINLCLQKFRMAITPYYATLIDPCNPKCPVRLQSIPSVEELSFDEDDFTDPLNEEAESPVENIVHRYPDRVLFLVTHKCSMYCRHCTRRRMVGEEDFCINEEKLKTALAYIRGNPSIRDVLISGGDPFVMSDDFLENIISRLREIPHVEIIRIGTRIPVVLPMRITDDLLGMLRKYHPIWINTHFNHPGEITEYSAASCQKIVDAGIPLGNQSVLLKDINDNLDTMKELLLKLVKIRVRPYYLYQCDAVKGIEHFKTRVETGIDIMKNLRGYISGFAVPSFVIDTPGGGGKVPVNPEYIVEISDRRVVVKNYKDEYFQYPQVSTKNVSKSIK